MTRERCGSGADDVVIDIEGGRSGDVVIVSGDPGRHGIAILAARENLGFEKRRATAADLLD